ncbi:hypothetical protein SCLARK_00831 [Spiroplasma clarkii]|nr:hypothetical protein SCLARK_00831 [Spiroplasma clarkii]
MIKSINFGKNNKNPIATEQIALIILAAAQISLIFLALMLYSKLNKSTKFSIEVLTNSKPTTTPIVKIRIDHSMVEIFNQIPKPTHKTITIK